MGCPRCLREGYDDATGYHDSGLCADCERYEEELEGWNDLSTVAPDSHEPEDDGTPETLDR